MTEKTLRLMARILSSAVFLSNCNAIWQRGDTEGARILLCRLRELRYEHRYWEPL